MTSQAPRQLKMIVAENIATARRDKGLTQRQLAEAVGTEGFAVSRWERATVSPSTMYLAAIAKALGREFAWFYTDHSPANEAPAA